MANDATIDLRLLTKKFIKDTRTVEKVMLGLRNKMKQVTDAARKMLLIGGAAIAGFIKLASDFEENLSKFNAVFKDNAKAVGEWAKTYSASVNRSRVDTMAFLATLQDTFVPLGFARDKAAELSKQVVQLATDLASFNNQSDASVVQALTSALVGNTETVRKYGIVITESTLKQELLNMGIKGGSKSATEAEKAFARLNIIMASTSDAQGDAARTSGSFANQLKGLIAAAKELGIELGNVFLPTATKLVKKIKEVIPGMIDWVKINQDVILSWTKIAATVGAGVLIFEKITSTLIPLGILVVQVAANWTTLLPILAAVKVAALPVVVALSAITLIITPLLIAYRKMRTETKAMEKALKLTQIATENSAKAWDELAEARQRFSETDDARSREDLAKVQVSSLQKLLDLRNKEADELQKTAGVPEQVFENMASEILQITGALFAAEENLKRLTQARIAAERVPRVGQAATDTPLSDEAKKLKEQVDSIVSSLREQNDTWGLANDQIQLYQLRQKGVADADVKQIDRLQKLLQKRKDYEQSLEKELNFKFEIAKAEAQQLRDIQDANAAEFDRAKKADEQRKKKAADQKAARIESLEAAHQRILATAAGRTALPDNKQAEREQEQRKITIIQQFPAFMQAMIAHLAEIAAKGSPSPVTP